MSDSPKAFAISAAEGVAVHVDDTSADENFVITVMQKGATIETHEGVTADTVGALTSDHFTVEHVDAPVAEAGEEPGQQEDVDD